MSHFFDFFLYVSFILVRSAWILKLLKGLINFVEILKVASVEVPLFVTFHFINAYEEEDEDERMTAIIADCCEHNADTTILDKLRLQNLRSFNGEDVLPDARWYI